MLVTDSFCLNRIVIRMILIFSYERFTFGKHDVILR